MRCPGAPSRAGGCCRAVAGSGAGEAGGGGRRGAGAVRPAGGRPPRACMQGLCGTAMAPSTMQGPSQ